MSKHVGIMHIFSYPNIIERLWKRLTYLFLQFPIVPYWIPGLKPRGERYLAQDRPRVIIDVHFSLDSRAPLIDWSFVQKSLARIESEKHRPGSGRGSKNQGRTNPLLSSCRSTGKWHFSCVDKYAQHRRHWIFEGLDGFSLLWLCTWQVNLAKKRNNWSVWKFDTTVNLFQGYSFLNSNITSGLIARRPPHLS